MKGGFAAIKTGNKLLWAKHHGDRSIAFADAIKIKCSIVVRARKGASFSLRSKENSGDPKVGRELPALRRVTSAAMQGGLPVPAFAAALAAPGGSSWIRRIRIYIFFVP